MPGEATPNAAELRRCGLDAEYGPSPEQMAIVRPYLGEARFAGCSAAIFLPRSEPDRTKQANAPFDDGLDRHRGENETHHALENRHRGLP